MASRSSTSARTRTSRSAPEEADSLEPLRINLFTIGDCADIGTWSNLPYYLYRALCARVEVTPINLVPPGTWTYRSWTRLMNWRDRAAARVFGGSSCDRLRTRSYHLFVNKHLQRTARAHPGADLNLFLTFSFSSYKYTGVPVVHYCDRTYEHHLEELGKTPDRNDRRFVRIDRTNIENADLVLTTNEPCRDFIQGRYNPKRVVYLRTGINTNVRRVDPDALISDKRDSKDILFIGRDVRSRGADVLIPAFRIFNERQGGDFTLHVVGIDPADLAPELREVPRVRFYGYLDRSVASELGRYNALVRSAKMFVLPMRSGPYPAVVREVMWHCTPVIVSDVSWELVRDGREGIVARSLEPAEFAHQMSRLIADARRWEQMARCAHASIHGLTWDKTVENLLDVVADGDLVRRGAKSAGWVGGVRSEEC